MKKINRLINFIRRENGGVTAIFMIMLPMMLAFFALAFDGALVMLKKTRLADGLNEAALAIAAGASNGDTGDIAKNNALLRQYINYYLPNDEIVIADVSTRAATGSKGSDTIFDIKAEIKFNTVLPMSETPSFANTVNLDNQGSVRKNISPGRPADYVFVVDFSGSMDFSSSEKNMTRIELLKKVVKDITERALKDQPESTFGFVPFENGVPIKLEGKNDAGGDRLGCSALFVPYKNLTSTDPSKHINYDIDYAFWANKNLQDNPGTNKVAINRQLDLSRYNYFNGIVLKALKLTQISLLTQNPYNFCVLNTGQHGIGTMPAYHCERKPELSIYTPENQHIIDSEFKYTKKVYNDAYSADSIFNYNSINYAATLERMFDESAVISFEQTGPLGYGIAHFPFSMMCSSRGVEYYDYDLQNYKRNTYLIELTSDKDIIDEFQNMTPNGGTESSVGLLRAVPVLTKGHNARKVMIVISDGEDNYTEVRDNLHKQHNVCEAIRKGIPKHSPATEEVSIYFISISASSADDERVQYWGKYCTGMDNSVIAANYSDLMTKLVEITNNAEETGFFNVDL